MRILTLIVVALAGVSLAVPAQAQRVWRDGQWVQRSGGTTGVQRGTMQAGYPARSIPDARIALPRQGHAQQGGRWGGKVGGRWHAGMRAPGGWGAYRRPVRGWSLPSYWIGGSFFLSDWSNWGLSRPPHGYNWVRYYDDAVLVDRDGRVWDSVNRLNWDRGDFYADGSYTGESYGGGEGYAYSDGGYAYAQGGSGGQGGYGATYAQPQPYQPPRYAPQPYQPAPIPAQPYPGGYAPSAPAYAAPAAPPPCGANCGYSGGYAQGYTQRYAGSSYGGGYYYGAPSTTTVVIQSAPVVTTTIVEEVIEEEVVYSAPRVVRRTPAKRKWRPAPKKQACGCACVCR